MWSLYKNKKSFALVLSLVIVLVQGCTNRAWYEGFKSSERFRCQHLSSPEYEECLRQSDVDYDTYKNERDKQTEL